MINPYLFALPACICVCVCSCTACLVQGALAQIRRALKPDGLFLGAMLGGQTMQVRGEARGGGV
jgi:SAM-dependent methyltransferase